MPLARRRPGPLLAETLSEVCQDHGSGNAEYGGISEIRDGATYYYPRGEFLLLFSQSAPFTSTSP